MDPTDVDRRARALAGFADRLESEREPLARALVRDLGVTIRSARDDLTVAACLLREHREGTEGLAAFDPDRRRPLGRVAIMLPVDQVAVCGAASIGGAYLAGNDVAVRLPLRVPTFLASFRRLVEDSLAGVTVAETDNRQFLAGSFQDPDLRAIVCFGDDRWMSRYRDTARRTHTKVIFEGPGKDPFVVCADADVDGAAAAAVESRFSDGALSTASPERYFVHESVAGRFVSAVVERARSLRVGPPDSEETDVGPLRSPIVVERLKKQLEDARHRGARVQSGAEFVRIPGCRYETCVPAVLTECTAEMDVLREETSGPVLPICVFRDEEELLSMVDDTRYGLGATLFGGGDALAAWLAGAHARVVRDRAARGVTNPLLRLTWGGYRNSAWIWEFARGNFVHREGPRTFVRELSRPRERSEEETW
jgi:betaine-aldehyde dehydrogenase